MGLIRKLLKMFNSKNVKKFSKPKWLNEDKRLPIWVRKAVSSYKQTHDVYTGSGTKKVFFGKKYVYKFTWWTEVEWQAPTPCTEYREEWVRERRRY